MILAAYCKIATSDNCNFFHNCKFILYDVTVLHDCNFILHNEATYNSMSYYII